MSIGRKSLSSGRGQARPPFSSSASEPGEDETDDLRQKVVKSGGVPLAETDILLLSDQVTYPGVISREKAPFVSSMGELEKLVVNILMVVYVP